MTVVWLQATDCRHFFKEGLFIAFIDFAHNVPAVALSPYNMRFPAQKFRTLPWRRPNAAAIS
jgi:hypothetical protein